MHDEQLAAPQCWDEPQSGLDVCMPLKAKVEWRDLNSRIKPGLAFCQFTSVRTGRRFLTRSTQERELLLLVDLITDVEDARLKPAVVTFRHKGIERSTEPILWIRRSTREELWFDTQRPDSSPALEADLREQLVPLGMACRLVSLQALLEPARIDLARSIRRHSRHPVDSLVREHVRRELRDGAQPVFWQDVTRGKHPTLRAGTVCRLMLDGVLRLAPSGRVRPETRIELTEPNSQTRSDPWHL